MPDGSKPCAYRKEHEWDPEGVCVHCYAKRPLPPPNPYGWVAAAAQATADEPLGQSDITTVRLSRSGLEILNWEELLEAQAAGKVLILRNGRGALEFRRMDPK